MERSLSGSEERERVVYEFGSFRADPVRRVLSRRGEPVAITPKALSILLVLLERAGDVVEKKELIERVWPGMFVSDANLTQNVFSLRKTLGERAAGRGYIVTIPGQGYSFVGEVQRLERLATAEIPIVVDFPAPAAVEEAGGGELPETAAPAPAAVTPPASRRVPFGALAVVLALMAIGAALLSLLPAPRQPRRESNGVARIAVRPAIAVLAFKNLSPSDDRRWLDTAFAEMLTTDLAEGGALRVIRGEAVSQAWRSLALPDPAGLSPADLQRLHAALGVNYVVIGAYLPLGGKIRLDLRVLQAPTGETVVSFPDIGTEDELFELVSRAGGKLRKRLEIAELSPQQVREARAQHPSNPQAQKLYSAGLARLRDFDPTGALPLLRQAAAADPEAAAIRSALSQAWSVLGYDVRAEAEARRALELSKALPRETRLANEALYYKAAKNWDKAGQTYRSLWTFFPDDVEYGLQLAESLMSGSRGTEAGETLAALRKLPPPLGEDPRIDLVEARNAWRLADYATEKRAAERAAAKGRKYGQSLVVAQALVFQGQAVLQMGRTQEAIGLYRESAALCERSGYQWGVGRALANIGSTLQTLGDLEGARKAHEESLAIARRLDSAIGMASQLYNLGELHRQRGELAEALPLLEQSRQWWVKMGDRLMEAWALNAAGLAMRDRGDLAGAQQKHEQALDLSQATGNPANEGASLANLGRVLAARGELAEARRRLGEGFSKLLRSGDSSQAASALADWSAATARLGDFQTAWERSAQAQAVKERAGDRLGAGHILGLRAGFAYEMGDLATSRALAAQQLRIARETGAKGLEAWGLQILGRVELAAGDLAAARASFVESLRSASARGEELRAEEVRLDLAGLAREAAAWYGAQEIPGSEAAALSLLAEALLAQGRKAEARQTVEEAGPKVEASEDRALRVAASVRLARVQAGLGYPDVALELLRHAGAEAATSGLAAAGLEARLALGEAQRGLRDPAAAATLEAVRREAEERGFKRLAAPT
jgi:DNA-binding winged helix-turn-helix (wHTH) protein/tetratricopeptide (TPR) repeat protein